MSTPILTTDAKRASLNDRGARVLITAGRYRGREGTMLGIGGGLGNGRWTQLVALPGIGSVSVRSAYRIREDDE